VSKSSSASAAPTAEARPARAATAHATTARAANPITEVKDAVADDFAGAKERTESISRTPRKPAKSTGENTMGGPQRLQKLLSRAGISSRRAAEEIIEQGRVSVNGHIMTELGFKADPDVDRIVVDGQPLRLPTGPATVLLLHKPTGVVTTKKDPEGRTTITHLLPEKYRHLHTVGRLDFDTSGVLLLTDDGSLTQLLTHPSHGVEKVYWARVRGIVTVETLRKLEAGVFLDDGKTAPCKARVRAQTERNALIQLTLREGRNRQVRRMLEAVGYPVRALRRVKFADLALEGLLAGEFRVLLPGEVHALRKAAEKPKSAIKPRGAPTKARAARDAAQMAEGTSPTRHKAAVKPGASKAKPKSEVNIPKSKIHPVAQRVEKQWGQKTRKRAPK
jgi:23S rRNA pseudouridine2605 synthase